jgi:alanine or glycine:cation symporter, AGCS family
MDVLRHWIGKIDSWAWGPVMITLLVGTGLYLTVRLGLIQIRMFPHALRALRGDFDSPEDEGDISHFQTLAAVLSATIGTGNIAGVATAIAAGGPGALVWMWVTAAVGMVTKYAESLLSHKYRVFRGDGMAAGGPMYVLERGLGLRWLGILFAVFAGIASFGIGNMVQSNSVADALNATFGIPAWVSGLAIALLAGVVILGGIKRIAVVASRIVPIMAAGYVFAGLVVLIARIDAIPAALMLIVYEAFTPSAAAGGFLGATVAQGIRYGVARGVFSNEAGLGSAPMGHAAARTNEPAREGFVAMLGPFIDTIVICTITGLTIVVSGAWQWVDSAGAQLSGAPLTSAAFGDVLGNVGEFVVSIGLVLFAFSTIISWSYYGDRCFQYLFGDGAVLPYRVIYTLIIPIGAIARLETVWGLSDIANALMALPNLIALLLLSGVVLAETRSYINRHVSGELP